MSYNPEIIANATWAAAGMAVVASLGEWWHGRRVRRLQRLAFGPSAKPRAWTAVAAPLRVLALAGAVWSLVILAGFEGGSRMRERNAAAVRHLMVLLDVSPSMQLADAGEGGHELRAARAAQVLRSVLNRAPSDEVRITMACFYSYAMPLVKECSDREVIWNFADNLPLYIAYKPGKTDLIKSLNQAGEMVKDFPRKSTTLLVLSDGDTVPDSGLKPLPSSVARVIFAGVGDAARGSFIDGHLSRQEAAALSQLSRRLGGQYHNGNMRNVPDELLGGLIAADKRADQTRLDLRALAIFILALAAGCLCALPVLLEYVGSGWREAGAQIKRANDLRVNPKNGPLTPALSPSEGERENLRPAVERPEVLAEERLRSTELRVGVTA